MLHSANIEYVKWDMNRPLCDMGSAALSADCQGELFHRYVRLGMYSLQERLVTVIPAPASGKLFRRRRTL